MCCILTIIRSWYSFPVHHVVVHGHVEVVILAQVQTTHCSHVCRGFCLQCLPHGASWMDANRGSSGLDPDDPGSPSSFSAVAQCTPDTSKRSQSAVLKIQAPRQYPPKTDPLKSKITRFEAALNSFRQEQLEAMRVWRKLSKKAKTEGISESQDTTRRPPEVSLAEANAKMVREGSLAATGPTTSQNCWFSRMRWRWSVPHCRSSGATPGRTREILRARGEAPREGTGSCGRSVEGADSTGGRVGGGEASLISAETSLEQRIDLLFQEVAALRGRLPAPVSG